MSLPRGVSNHNPGNIDYNEVNKWQGLVGKEPDGRFCVFRSPQYGIRALAVLLLTYQDRHSLRTVREIINRWAPPSENSTTSYISRVCALTDFMPNDPLDLHRYAHMQPLVKAIISVECAGFAYPATIIDEALTMAGVPPSPANVAVRSSTTTAAVGTAASGAAATAALPVIEAVAPHLGVATTFVQAAGPWLVAAVLIGAAAFFIWQRYQRQRKMETADE